MVDHPDGTRGIAGTPDVAGPAEELSLVEVQPATHGPDITRIEIRADVVLEIRDPVLGRHVEQQFCIRGIPIEILREIIGGDGESENPAVHVPSDHQLEKGLVDHVHFLLVIPISRVLLLSADDGALVLHVIGNRPVEGQVGKGRLPPPP